jgi:hypothetical protein
VSQRDYDCPSAALVPEVRNESENFGRDPVDWGEPVPPGSNQTEDLESVPLENIDLKHDACTYTSTRLVSWLGLTSS